MGRQASGEGGILLVAVCKGLEKSYLRRQALKPFALVVRQGMSIVITDSQE